MPQAVQEIKFKNRANNTAKSSYMEVKFIVYSNVNEQIEYNSTYLFFNVLLRFAITFASKCSHHKLAIKQAIGETN